MSLKLRLAFSVGLVTLISFIILSTIFLLRFRDTLIKEETNSAITLANSIHTELDLSLNSTLISVNSIANNPQVQEYFAQRDREALIELLLPVYETIKTEVAQFQFHLPDSSSFLRLHKLDKYGDSLKDFRYTVNEANASLKPAIGIEEGVAGYGLRVVVPMFYQGEHIGSFEYGNDFGSAYLQSLKESHSGEYYLYRFEILDGTLIQDDRSLLASTTDNDLYPIDMDILLSLTEGFPIFTIDQNDPNIGIILLPNRDFADKISSYTKIIVDRSEVVNALNQTTFILAIVSILFILATLVAVYFIVQFNLRKLVKLKVMTEIVAQGDFSKNCQIKGKDEIATLSTNFNQMISNLRDIITQITSSTLSINNKSQLIVSNSSLIRQGNEEVTQSAYEIAKGSTEQAEEAERTLHSMNQLSQQIDEMSSRVNHSKATVQAMVKKTAIGTTTIQKLNETMETHFASTHEVGSKVNALKAMSDRIGDITESIQGISAQTHLLALNAAIEAARAGEHGRGFAVVAEEVKKLAEQSTVATKNIQDIILNIETLIDETTTTTRLALERSDLSQQMIRTGMDVFIEIESSSASVTNDVEQLLESVNTTIKSKETVLSAIENISAVTQESAAASEQVSSIASENNREIEEIISSLKELSHSMEELKESISQFKTE